MSANVKAGAILQSYEKPPSESAEQQMLFRWADLQLQKYPELRLMFHIPNGGSRRKSEAGRFRAEGVKAGVPDIFLPVARKGYHGIFIEMKRTKGGRVSDNQEAWKTELERQGFAAFVCQGFEEAKDAIIAYLE